MRWDFSCLTNTALRPGGLSPTCPQLARYKGILGLLATPSLPGCCLSPSIQTQTSARLIESSRRPILLIGLVSRYPGQSMGLYRLAFMRRPYPTGLYL
eukprot:XP_001704210.1 Hypothetical protein GL50803_89333 [Giardia lamblia ATCC 50803]